MKTICVLKGGSSSERDISLLSGAAVANELNVLGHRVSELDPKDYGDLPELLKAIIATEADLVFMSLQVAGFFQQHLP